ncbi:MAG: glycosyltransferase family 4 protein [Azospirillaceae bacterium]
MPVRRVLHVVRQYAPSIGGLETYTREMAIRQRRRGIETEVLTLDRVFNPPAKELPRRETIDGVPVRRVGSIGGTRYFLPLVDPRSLRNVDLIHVHAIDPFFDMLAATRTLHGRPLVATTHGGFFHTDSYSRAKRLFFRTVTPASARAYALLLANSANDAETFTGLGPPVRLAPNAVVPLADRPLTGPDLLALGRLSENKRPDLLVDFMAALARHRPAARLHIVGPDSAHTRDSLTAAARARGVADRVTVHGFVDAATLSGILGTCGYYVSASRFEGFGMSLIEAMSAGLVPIVQDNAAFAELVGAAGVGTLTDFAEPARAAADAAGAMARVEAEDSSAGAAGGERRRAVAFSRHYDWDALVDTVTALYETALAGPRRSATPEPMSRAGDAR